MVSLFTTTITTVLVCLLTTASFTDARRHPKVPVHAKANNAAEVNVQTVAAQQEPGDGSGNPQGNQAGGVNPEGVGGGGGGPVQAEGRRANGGPPQLQNGVNGVANLNGNNNFMIDFGRRFKEIICLPMHKTLCFGAGASLDNNEQLKKSNIDTVIWLDQPNKEANRKAGLKYVFLHENFDTEAPSNGSIICDAVQIFDSFDFSSAAKKATIIYHTWDISRSRDNAVAELLFGDTDIKLDDIKGPTRMFGNMKPGSHGKWSADLVAIEASRDIETWRARCTLAIAPLPIV